MSLPQALAPAREPPKPITPYTTGVERVTDRQGSGAKRDNPQNRQRRETQRHEGQSSDNAGHSSTATLASALALLDLGGRSEEHIPDTSMGSAMSLDNLLSNALSASEG